MVPSKVVETSKAPARQRDLHVWPEKVMWSSILLFLVAAIGVLTGILAVTAGLGHTERAPDWLVALSPWYVITVSVFTGLFAYMGVTQRSTGFTTLAGIFGVLSFGFYGANLILSAVALTFVALANKERHDDARSAHLTKAKAPHTPIAGSLVMLAAGVVTFLWGIVVTFDLVSFSGYFGPDWLFGLLTIVVGLVAIAGAWALATTRGIEMAIVAAVFVVASASLFVVGPALALVAIALALLERHDLHKRRTSRARSTKA